MLHGGSFIVTWKALPQKGQLLTNRLTSVWRSLCPLPCIVLKKNVAYHSLCLYRAKAESQPQIYWLGSRTHQQSSDCLAPYPWFSPKNECERCPPHCLSQVLLLSLWEARGGLLNTCYVQLLRPCTASMLRPCGGVYTVPKPGTLICVLIHPVCQFPPPSPPLTLLWWLCGNWRGRELLMNL